MAEEKKEYIEGIYNYCDRWCEKCRFTANCYLFTTESRITSYQILNDGEMPKAADIFPKPDSADDENDDFFNEEYDNDEEDFDLGDEELTQEDDEEDDRKFFELNNTPLEELTDEYMEKSHPLIKKLDEKYNFYQTPKETIDPALKKLYDNFEIFSYYHAFIHVKFKRATHGKIDILKEDDEEMKEFHAYDMNGTAKIALISISNSIEALNKLFSSLPEFHKEISELLILAGKIKNEAEKEFPDCYNFKRPGFDD